MLSFEDLFKSLNCLANWNITSFQTCKLCRNVEWLGKESLDLSCSGYDQLIFFGKFIHTKNCNDILQFFVFLKNFLYSTGYFIVFFSDNVWIQNT